MANLIQSLARKIFFGKTGNLISFDEPYAIVAKLLGSHEVTGILDIGASNGRICQRLIRLFPQATVYAFEPNPMYRETLQGQAAQEPRLKPQFLAVSDREGRAELNITESPGSTSLFKPGENLTGIYPEESHIQSVEEVETVTLDGWAGRQGNPAIQLLKFDIQGGELNALEGADSLLHSSALLVYTEILFNPLYEGGAIYSEIDLCLREKGFVLYDIFKPRYHKNGKVLWGNAIFVHAQRMGI
ncbi:MAG: FkbM family methyltransferase [bacterium]|nr:FkbM family methyltransferase [bacterium]